VQALQLSVEAGAAVFRQLEEEDPKTCKGMRHNKIKKKTQGIKNCRTKEH
jgi:hypothetical protein